MPINRKYKPKHRRDVAYTDGVSRGPARWLRAYANAFERPNSSGAKLLHKRIALAHRVRELHPESEKQACVFWKDETRWNPDLKRAVSTFDAEWTTLKPQYYTCGIFCTTLQVQLDYSQELGESFEMLEMFLERDARVMPLWIAKDNHDYELRRIVRCQVCGVDIDPKRHRRAAGTSSKVKTSA